jgi:hypothetical protein
MFCAESVPTGADPRINVPVNFAAVIERPELTEESHASNPQGRRRTGRRFRLTNRLG